MTTTTFTVTGIHIRETSLDGKSSLELQADLEPGAIVSQAIDQLRQLTQRELHRGASWEAEASAPSQAKIPRPSREEYICWEDSGEVPQRLAICYPDTEHRDYWVSLLNFDWEKEAWEEVEQCSLGIEQMWALVATVVDHVGVNRSIARFKANFPEIQRYKRPAPKGFTRSEDPISTP